MAFSHRMLVILYHMWRDKKPYRDLETDYFDKQASEQIERQAVHRLEQLSYSVVLTHKEEVAWLSHHPRVTSRGRDPLHL